MGRRGYPPEFRRKVLDLVETGRPIAEVAQALGISEPSIDSWRRQDRIDRGVDAGLTPARRRSWSRPSGASPSWRPSCRPCAGRWSWSERWCPQRRFQAVAVMAAEHIPVEVACRVLDVSTSGYYAWRVRPPSARAIRHAWLTDLIAEVHQACRGTYGALRVHAELRLGRGILVGHNAVALLMRRAGLAGATGRPKWRHAKPDQIAADLVDRQFSRSGPNQLWVTDITEHPTREGKVSCAVVLDSFSRRVVGWSIDATPTAALVTNALGVAIQTRTQWAGQLVTRTWAVRLLGVYPAGPGLGPGALHGVGRRPLRHNAMIEGFWSRMQVELLNRHRWRTRVELANAILDYLEILHITGNAATAASAC
jgi:transposase InsO family protein